MEKKVCQWCEKEFQPKRKDSKYCSDQHYTKCLNCEKTITIKLMKRIPKYCSGGCSSQHQRNDRNFDCVCQICGEDFKGKKSTDKYCTKTHYKNCVICKKEFVIDPYQEAQTCSKKCASLTIDFKERNKKSIKTTQEKYGVDNVSQAQEIKNKKAETLFGNYGVGNPSLSPEVKKKREKTFLEKYGVLNPLLLASIQKKVKNTNLERYGVENPFGNKDIQEKIKQTILEKYGVDNVGKSPEIIEKVKQTNLEKYGVETVLLLEENISKANERNKRVSKLNKKWHDILEKEFGLDFQYEVKFGKYYADLGYDNVLIDINPSVTHNSSYPYAHFFKFCREEDCVKHLPLAENYHKLRALEAESEGKILLQYFDWMNPLIFLNVVRSKLKKDENRIYARQTQLREITQKDANAFLREYHLAGASNSQSVCLGLFYDDELVHVQTYGKSRMNKNVEWEAVRACTKGNTQVLGGYSKCDSYFKKIFKPKSIVSYVDLSYSFGETEANNDGWKLLRENKPSGTWVNLLNNDNPLFVRENTARRVGADRLLGFEVGEKYPLYDEDGEKISNDFVLLAEGYVKVFGAGSRTFVYSA